MFDRAEREKELEILSYREFRGGVNEGGASAPQ